MLDPKNIEENFILHFDTKFWLNKSTIIKQLLDNEKLMAEFPIDDSPNSDFLLKDLHMTKVHCCETFLRLFLVIKKHPYNPIIPLISIPSRKYNSEIKKMLKDGMDKYLESDKILGDLFFPYNLSKPEDNENKELSIKFIKTAIELIAHDYIDHKYYNVLKHGFYGTTIKNFSLSVKDPKTEKDIPIGKASRMLTWFELESKGNEHNLIERNTAFSPDREVNIIKIVTAILEKYFSAQKSRIKKEDNLSITFFTKEAYDNLKKTFSQTSYGQTMLNFKEVRNVIIPKELLDF